MDKKWSLFITIQLSLLLFGLPYSPPTRCHEKERSNLLEFKKRFFNKTEDSCYFGDDDTHRKIESWKLELDSGNCCAWDGIECDLDSNHVIAVELGASCLIGTISSNTTLFHLTHLQKLNLNHNRLQGQVPSELLRLINLSSLDLSYNYDLELKKPNILDLVQNLTKLENLSLSWVNISASVPNTLANLSSLRSLRLRNCYLQGEFPPIIFKMPKLEILDVSYNFQLLGHLPDFYWRSSLKSLSISNTNMSGQLPSSLGNLASLNELILGYSNFVSHIPSSLGNLTQLRTLHIVGNQLIGEFPIWIRNLTQLTELSLQENQLTGAIPSWIGQLSNIEMLDLGSNKFTGEIPSSFFNLTRLSEVELGFNNFTGSIPSSMAELKDLEELSLLSNNFNGTVHMSLFSKLKSIDELYLSFNKLSLVDDLNGTNTNFTKFSFLGLASCNLSTFPTFLQHQDSLLWLDLSNNNLSGEIPEWFLKMNMSTMWSLNLSSNSLTNSATRPLNFRWKSLETLDLRNNNLKGPLPLPPASVIFYLISRNKLSGNIPSQICELRGLQGLDLAENNLTGVLPRCFNGISDHLTFLSLHHNNFSGEISSIISNGDCNLMMVDVSKNHFHGSLPRSLTGCHDLEFLNLGSNRIKDAFPFWLGSLRYLRVLILHSNQFHGAIRDPESNDEFSSLQIIDLSFNNFENCLPSMYFECWHAMKIPSPHQENYMGAYEITFEPGTVPLPMFDYTITIVVNGLEMSYPKIQSYLTVIDLSSNNFTCEIPRTIEGLLEVQHLNFSNNHLSGPIPSFLKALKSLESLDLSRNNLTGKIPPELTQLTFLGTFNVSYNDLIGEIPEGRQFDTFDNSSYFGNRKLCGVPLSKKCDDVGVFSQPNPQLEGEREESIAIDWKVVLTGYGSGLVTGVVIGWRCPLKPPRWILKYFGRRAQIRRR